jgi:hypothetical protein
MIPHRPSPAPRHWRRRLVVLLLPVHASIAAGQTESPPARFANPPGLSTPTGYTHVVVAPDQRTVYIAGQVALSAGPSRMTTPPAMSSLPSRVTTRRCGMSEEREAASVGPCERRRKVER